MLAPNRRTIHISRHESYGSLNNFYQGSPKYNCAPDGVPSALSNQSNFYKSSWVQPLHSIHENDPESLLHLDKLPESYLENIANFDLPDRVAQANVGMKKGVKPLLADGAMGGTYFLRDEKNNFVLVCKPGDEEPNSPHNPHQTKQGETVWRGWYRGRIVPGFGMYREVATFLLDGGFAGVPPTQLARVRDNLLRSSVESQDGIFSSLSTASVYKICSVQSYARHECSAEDMGPGKFVKDDVHRIAALDIRLCNLDRHEGNMLVCRSNPYHRVVGSLTNGDNKLECDHLEGVGMFWDVEDEASEASDETMLHLVPIDHGYVLPHVLCMNDPSLSWMNWPQVKEPMSASLLRHIKTLDYAKDVELLRRVVGAAISETSLLTLQVCTSFLKKGSATGLTLYEMGSAMCPDYSCRDMSPISQLQKAVHAAIGNVLTVHSSQSNSCIKSDFDSFCLASPHKFFKVCSNTASTDEDIPGYRVTDAALTSCPPQELSSTSASSSPEETVAKPRLFSADCKARAVERDRGLISDKSKTPSPASVASHFDESKQMSCQSLVDARSSTHSSLAASTPKTTLDNCKSAYSNRPTISRSMTYAAVVSAGSSSLRAGHSRTSSVASDCENSDNSSRATVRVTEDMLSQALEIDHEVRSRMSVQACCSGCWTDTSPLQYEIDTVLDRLVAELLAVRE